MRYSFVVLLVLSCVVHWQSLRNHYGEGEEAGKYYFFSWNNYKDLHPKAAIVQAERKLEQLEDAATIQYLLSNYELNGAEEQIDQFKGKWQSGYKEIEKLLEDKFLFEKLTMEKLLLHQLRNINSYESFHQQIKDEAERMGSVSIFANEASIHNIEKTREDYGRVEGISLSFVPIITLHTFFQPDAIDYFIIIFLAMVCLTFVEEKKKGLWQIIYAAPKGRGCLGIKRFGILLFTVFFAVFLFYFSKLLLCWLYFQVSPFRNNVSFQSLPDFYTFSYPFSIPNVLVLYYVVKCFGHLFIGCMIWLLLSKANTVSIGIIGMSIFTVIEFSLYTFLRDSNVFAFF